MAEEPKILFFKMKGFPLIDESNKKVLAEYFLEAAKEVVVVIESFGMLFSPVVNDMNGNIEKLREEYLLNTEKYRYLDDLICVKNETFVKLLWLKRGLELLEQFFTNILNDKNNEHPLKDHLRSAYNVTLAKYHSWFIRETCSLIYRLMPSRETLFGENEIFNENLKHMEIYLELFRKNLKHTNEILEEKEKNEKV